MFHVFFIHSSVDGCLCDYRLLAIVNNNTAMNIDVHVSEYLLLILLSMCLAVKLLDHIVIPCLNFLETHHTVLHRGYTILHFQQKCAKIAIFAQPWQHLPFSVAVLMCVRWYLIMVLICISLWAVICWVFAYLLWRNVQTLSPFLNCIICCGVVVVLLWILDINSLSNMWFVSIFFHSMGCLCFCTNIFGVVFSY